MRLNYMFFLLILVTAVTFIPVQKAQAQSDTLTVEWLDGDGNFIQDALRFAIVGDTLADGSRANLNRVYKLRKGGFYWITETIVNNGWALRIVGEDPDPNDPDGNPAVIQRVGREDGSVTGRIITGGGDITFKNLYFIGASDGGVQSDGYQVVQIDASDSRYIIDHCIFEQTNFALVAWTGHGNDIFLTNNIYRNLVEKPGTQQWAGRGVSIWGDQDTVVVENNTFFNVGFTAVQIETGAAAYFRFNHNTLVNIGRGFLTTPWLRTAYVANNLIVNGFWHGEGSADYNGSGRDPRSIQTGMFGFGDLPTKYGPEASRRILLANTAAWLDPAFTSYYGDTIRPQPFLGQVLREDFIDRDLSDQVRALDTMWLAEKPNFPVYPSEVLGDMVQFIKDIRSGSGNAQTYFWQPPLLDGDTCFTCPSWPLPEDFSYTTASIIAAGTDGLPLGDLNWFPEKKAEFEANMTANIAHLEELAGDVIVITPVGTFEAEAGTVGGSAAVEDYAGDLPYFRMEGGGSITWTFNMPEAKSVTLGVWTKRLDDGNVTRGQHIRVNGNPVRNNTGFGEWYWETLPVDWAETMVTPDIVITDNGSTPANLDLPAGTNTIQLAPSWGYQFFLKVVVYVDGVPVQSLDASNAVVDVVQIVSPDPTIYVPSGFKTVELGANGSIEWSVNVAEAGDYALAITYQAPGGSQTGQYLASGQSTNVEFTGEVDNNDPMNVFSSKLALAAGTQTVGIAGSNLNIDYVQLNRVEVKTDVTNLPGLPEGFALMQNYPNPFNPTTNIQFNLAAPTFVKLNIYNVLGQKVATLINNVQMNTGAYSYQFDARNLASGVYFYSLEAGDFKIQKKMLLLK